MKIKENSKYKSGKVGIYQSVDQKRFTDGKSISFLQLLAQIFRIYLNLAKNL